MTMRTLLATLLFVPLAAAQQPEAAPPPAAVPAASPAVAQPAPITPLSRIETYDEFRALFHAGRYAEALPLAQQVLRMTMEEDERERERELPTAYNNLGATQLRLGDFEAAEASYLASLELLEMTQGISSRRLIPALAGLGSVYAAQDQHARAIEYLQRAAAVSRRAEGLFNLDQMGLIEPMITSYQALGEPGGVEMQYRYVLQIAEYNFGPDDPRTLPVLGRLASLHESQGQYLSARALYLRMRDVSMQEGGGFNPATIAALLGVGRTHRMQYTLDPDSLEEPAIARDPVTNRTLLPPRLPVVYSAPGPRRGGQRAIEEALEMLRQAADPPPKLMAQALIEMGDWFMAAGRPEAAMPHYTEAWQTYPAGPDDPNPLASPRLIFYRIPPASVRGRLSVPGKVITRTAELDFSVNEDGRTTDVVLVQTDMSEVQVGQVRRALERAIYSPRIEDGKPVATTGLKFTGTWSELEQPATDSASGG